MGAEVEKDHAWEAAKYRLQRNAALAQVEALKKALEPFAEAWRQAARYAPHAPLGAVNNLTTYFVGAGHYQAADRCLTALSAPAEERSSSGASLPAHACEQAATEAPAAAGMVRCPACGVWSDAAEGGVEGGVDTPRAEESGDQPTREAMTAWDDETLRRVASWAHSILAQRLHGTVAVQVGPDVVVLQPPNHDEGIVHVGRLLADVLKAGDADHG